MPARDAQYKIRVVDTLECRGIELAEFEANVTVTVFPPSGDGWNEPREPGYYELAAVTQVSGPYMDPKALAEWAEAWVEANDSTISDKISDGRLVW